MDVSRVLRFFVDDEEGGFWQNLRESPVTPLLDDWSSPFHGDSSPLFRFLLSSKVAVTNDPERAKH